MATSIMVGQKALCALPPLPVMDGRREDSAEESIFTYELPIQLKLFDSKKNGTASKTLGHGLNVYKVSKNGIRQLRRVGISKDNQSILISTEKAKLGRLRKNKIDSTIMIGRDAFKVIEISAIEKIVRGQITEKFLKKTLDAPTMNMPLSEDKLSLSIVFRINNDIENIALEEDLQVTRDSSNTMATLDLVIPSHNDFELVISTIRNLMLLNKKYTNSMHRDLLLLRHHWKELNFPLDSRLSQANWSALCCGRLSVPISKRSVNTLYRQFCVAAKIRADMGIPMQMALGLLEHTRKLSLKSTLLEDPCESVWKKASIHSNAPSSSDIFPDTLALDMLEFGDGDNSMVIMNSTKARLANDVKVEEYISAEAFLKFLHLEQKETDKTLSDVNYIFERLNALTYASQLMSDGLRRDATDERVFSKMFITKNMFFDYLHSDANDAFDPVRGELEYDDMTQPLSCYWINASHDTYLKGVAPKMNQHTYGGDCPADIGMFTVALNRGSRCLDVDVWDGVGSQVGQPVVRFDDFSAPSKGMKSGLLFSDVMKTVRSFLLSQPASLPIILYLEVHCSVTNQNKMTQILKSLLVDDDMIYIPSDEGFEVENTSIPILPSPNELRGKVVLKFKIPRVGTTKVMCDDFDDVNDKNPFNPDEQLLNGEHDFDAIPGIQSVGSLLFDSSRDLDSEDKFEKVLADATKAKASADRADENAFSANIRAKRGKELAHQLLQKAGISLSEAEGKLEPLPKPHHTVHFDTNEPECQIIESVAESSSADETVDEKKMDANIEYQFENVVENVVDNVTKTAGFGRGGFMRQILGWADTLDGSNDEGRESTGTGGSFYSEDSSTGRDAGEYDDSDQSDEDSFDVGTFTDSPGHTMKDYIAKVADMADHYHEEESVHSDPEPEHDFAAAGVHRSISNVQKKIANLAEEEQEGGGIEIQNIYSSALDYIVVQHKEAQAKEMDAGKVLATATSKLTQAQEAHEAARKELDRHDVFETVDKLNEDILLLEERVKDLSEKKRVAETAAGTAQSEYRISEARAVETAEGSAKAHSTVQLANAKLQDERDREEEIEGELFEVQKQLDSATCKVKQVCTKHHMIKTELQRISRDMKKLEGSHLYVVEKKKLSRGVLDGEGVELRKHRGLVEKQLKLNQKLSKVLEEVKEAKTIQAVAQKNVDEVNDKYQEQCLKTSAAKDYALECESILDQYENYADEERGAADMRGEANKKAEARLANYEIQIAAALEELNEKRQYLQEVKFGDFTRDDVEKLRKKAEQKKTKVVEAELEFNEAQDWYKHTNLELSETTKSLKENKHILHKAKRNVDRLDHFANVDQMLRENALATYERSLKLQDEAEKAKVNATQERMAAAEAAIVARRAQDYHDRLGMMQEISQSLCDLVMFHSSKFVHFEKSLTLPQTTMHSISEGMMIQLLSIGEEENTSMFHELNKTHMTRIFPSRQKELRVQSNNFNPVLPWSLGCQIASINQQMRDAFVLVNDGRFRANGSCGYVLKPESMIDRNLILETKEEVVIPPRRKWNIKILSGQNIPKQRSKTITGNISPRVRVTLYDGSSTSPIVHLTNTAVKNGLNPVWNEKEGAVFSDIKDPDCAIFLFSVWDDVDGDKEDFLAAAAIPLSCMREGYRSIQLFDSGHMRCGAHAFTSLFVHAS